MRRGWKHITEKDRYQLEYMIKTGMKVKDIAEELGHSRSTIYREIKRGTVEQITTNLIKETRYLADTAQNDYDEKKREKGRNLKIGNDLDFVHYVEQKIKQDHFSPVAVLYSLETNTVIHTRVCHRTLYQYIHSGVFLNLTSNDLPYKASKKKEKKRRKIALKNIHGKSIDERPKNINDRIQFGDWEMDTVYSGKGTSTACLLVLTERQTRYEEVYYMESRTQDEVIRTLDNIEKEIGYQSFIQRYRTITSDNGVEFLDHMNTERSVLYPDQKRTTIYYCHPFASCERGSNENQNKLIRRWIPKGTDISSYKDQIPDIQNWINTYPRKLFHGLSSIQYLKTLATA